MSSSSSPVEAVNRLLDSLPRTRFGRWSREVPAFRTLGVAGFYVAVALTLAGGLLTGRSLLVLAVICVVCALSFFVYVYARLWITGRETMVLLDQVWFAEACVAGTLWAMREPVLPYMDVVAVAMSFFLTAGRTGCLLVGCCHGRPSSVGIVYGEEHAREGFAHHLVGVRLFPVQAIEAAGLALIGVTGLVALPFAAPGRVFLWFLCGYGVLRFGMEGLRADERSHFLGLSRARWMALAEVALAVWIARGDGPPARAAALLALLVLALVGALVARHAFDARRRFRAPTHLAELHEAVAVLVSAPTRVVGNGAHPPPPARTTSLGVTLAVSGTADGEDLLHASISLPGSLRDLELLCELAGWAFPRAAPESARLLGGGVLHLLTPLRVAGPDGDAGTRSRELYGCVARRLQGAAEAEAPAMPEAEGATGGAGEDRRIYFGMGALR
jgi:hypothetical protein